MTDESVALAHDPYAALRNRDYRWFIASMGLVTLALQMQGVVVGWQVYARTGDPLALGLVGLSEAIPFLAVALFGGHAADRVNRRWLCLVSALSLAACGALLLLFTWGSQSGPWAGAVAPVYGIIFLTGLVRAFYRPASLALGTDLLPKELYANGSTWRIAVFQGGMVLGPALGGLVYAWRGPVTSHAVVTAMLVAGFVGMLPLRYAPRPVPPREGSIFASLGEGIRFVFARKLLLGAISLDLFAVLFGGAVAVLPVFAKEVLLVGPQGLGALRAAPAVGSILMGLALAHRPPLRRAGRTLLLCVAAFGGTMIAFALSRSFALSLFLLAASGAVDNVSMVVRATLMQTLTPQHMLGRVSSVNQVFIGSSNEIGAFESGLAARLMGLIPSVVFGGCMTLLVVACTAWRVPVLANLDKVDDAGEEPS
jgi:MFS family permease